MGTKNRAERVHIGLTSLLQMNANVDESIIKVWKAGLVAGEVANQVSKPLTAPRLPLCVSPPSPHLQFYKELFYLRRLFTFLMGM